MVDNDEKWQQLRTRFAEFPPHFYPEKTIEMLDTCLASESLRQLLPYISLGRLGLARLGAYDRGQMDEFVCLYFYQDRYTVSSYDNTEKRCFYSSKAAIDFVEKSIDKDNPFETLAAITG